MNLGRFAVAHRCAGNCRHYKLFADGIIINHSARLGADIIANRRLTVKLRQLHPQASLYALINRQNRDENHRH